MHHTDMAMDVLNHISYFNKIHRLYCVNTHIQNLQVWLKSVLPWLKYSIFLRDCYLLAHPVYKLQVTLY